MIFIECNNDYAFFHLLCSTYNKRQFRHFCKSKLIKSLHEGDFGTVIGICDEDDPNSNQPPYIEEFEIIQDLPNKGVKLLRHRKREDKYLIMLTPYLEKWLYHQARLYGIDPASYYLTRDPEELHHRFKVDDKPNFHRFLQKIIDSDTKLKILRKWIQKFS